jgi:hypothetical protein
MNARGFFDTPERATAWIFRALITLVGAAGTTVLWLAWGALQDVKAEMHDQNKTVWTALGTLSTNQNQMATTLGVLSQTVSDNFKGEAQIIGDLRKEADDHEDRIRVLEHPH